MVDVGVGDGDGGTCCYDGRALGVGEDDARETEVVEEEEEEAGIELLERRKETEN